MAAEIHFRQRGEPAQLEAVAFPFEESGLRQIVLGRDLLQDRIRQPFLQDAEPSRVAAEGPSGKGINMVIRNAHNLWFGGHSTI